MVCAIGMAKATNAWKSARLKILNRAIVGFRRDATAAVGRGA
jgi:hypothetical protein